MKKNNEGVALKEKAVRTYSKSCSSIWGATVAPVACLQLLKLLAQLGDSLRRAADIWNLEKLEMEKQVTAATVDATRLIWATLRGTPAGTHADLIRNPPT